MRNVTHDLNIKLAQLGSNEEAHEQRARSEEVALNDPGNLRGQYVGTLQAKLGKIPTQCYV